MTAALIGLSTSMLTILLIASLKRLDKTILYGLILMGIAFLYIGFTWTSLETVILNSLQALVFLMLAYLGMKKSTYFLVVGYFLHGAWDMSYSWLASPMLLPPHYDLFCMTYDFIVGFYLLLITFSAKKITS